MRTFTEHPSLYARFLRAEKSPPKTKRKIIRRLRESGGPVNNF